MLTQSQLKDFIHYDADTGIFTRINSQNGIIKTVANSGTGYFSIRLLGKVYKAHRLAWLYIHGEWPKVLVHINFDKLDNRLVNLQELEHKENMSGAKGVSYYKAGEKWRAEIGEVFLGYFDTPAEASQAYDNYSEV